MWPGDKAMRSSVTVVCLFAALAALKNRFVTHEVNAEAACSYSLLGRNQINRVSE